MNVDGSPRGHFRIVGDAGQDWGIQRLSVSEKPIGVNGGSGHGTFIILVVGKMAYVRADAFVLRYNLRWVFSRKEASRFANRWISVPDTATAADGEYAQLVADVTLPSLLADHIPANRLTVGSSTVRGQRVEALRGWSDNQFIRTVYVRPVARPLPIGFTVTDPAEGSHGSIAVGPWNRSRKAHAPSHAIPFLTVETSGA